jgi:hypothetical protein
MMNNILGLWCVGIWSKLIWLELQYSILVFGMVLEKGLAAYMFKEHLDNRLDQIRKVLMEPGKPS